MVHVREALRVTVHNRLELTHRVSRKADQHAIPIIQLGMYQCDHQHLKSDGSGVADVAGG